MANYKEWFLQIRDARNGRPIDDDSGVVNVLVAGSPTEVSLMDRFGTALANPLTFTDGRIHFFTEKSVASVDLAVLTASGYAIFAQSMSSSEQGLIVCREMRQQVLVVPFAAIAAETDTGFDLPANCLVDDAYVNVTTVDSGITVDVGLLSSEGGGDADGFLDGASVATAGVVISPRGVLIDHQPGAYSATVPFGKHLTDGVAKSITYTCSGGADTAAGYIILGYTKL